MAESNAAVAWRLGEGGRAGPEARSAAEKCPIAYLEVRSNYEEEGV